MTGPSRRALGIFAVLAATALAGCADDPAPGGPVVNPEDLAAGKGAIDGLLVDDRFRPIQLVDNPVTEFQARGFILLQETGDEVQTNENGEFRFVNLEPGQYTLRVTAEGHEAKPTRVNVVAGEFAEAQIEARRTSSETSFVITQDYSVFIPCSFAIAPAGWVTANCLGDLSGDSYRSGIHGLDYTAFPEATFLVSELVANAVGNYLFTVREDDGTPFGGSTYGIDIVENSDYMRVIVENGTAYPQEDGSNSEWMNDRDLSVILFVSGLAGEETCSVWCGSFGEFGRAGLGANVGTQGRILVSLFLGPPLEDIETYCELCE